MKKLSELVVFASGSPQFRITEVFDANAPLFTYYSQADLADDLAGVISRSVNIKQVRTNDAVNTLGEGDVVFSLITGNAAMVSKAHVGYLYTQNYVKLLPGRLLDAKFLVYLLNENKFIRQQLTAGLQGSQVLKYTLQQLRELGVAKIPLLDRQKAIGEVYVKQLRLKALRNRAAELEAIIGLAKLEEASES